MRQDLFIDLFIVLTCSVCSFVCMDDFLEGSGKSVASLSNHDPRTAVQLRTALKRLKEIMEGKSQVKQTPLYLETFVYLWYFIIICLF